MSKSLKRKSTESESSSNQLDKQLEKKPKMQQQKTAISILYEECTRTKTKPLFTELTSDSDEIPEHHKSMEKKFWIKCSALGKTSIAGGATKQAAKQFAAQFTLKKIFGGMDDSDEDDSDDMETAKVSKRDYVTDLLNLCVLKNYHKPTFTEIDSYGPSHEPTFIMECRLSSIVRRATARIKTESKQLAAKQIYEILIASFPDMEKKVAIINETNLAKEEMYRKITTYMDLKARDKVHLMGTTIAERSNFFINHPQDEFINALKEILKKDTPVEQKYKELTDELEKMWKCEVSNFANTGLKQFQCLIDFDNFTVFLVASEENLKKEVVDYFKVMLNV